MIEKSSAYSRSRYLLKKYINVEDLFIYKIFALVFIQNLVITPVPYLIQTLVNNYLNLNLDGPLYFISFLVFSLVALSYLLDNIIIYIAEIFKRSFFTRNYYNISQTLNEAENSVINHRQVSRFIEVSNANVSIAELTKDLSQIIIVVFLATVIVSTYHPFFVVFCSVIIFVTFLTIIFLYPSLVHQKSIISDLKYKMNESLIKIIDSDYKVSDEDFKNLSEKYLRHKSNVFKIIISKSCLIGLLVALSLSIFLIVSGQLIFQTELSVGQFVAAELVVTYLLTNIYYFTRALEKFIVNIVSLDKIDSVLTAKIKVKL